MTLSVKIQIYKDVLILKLIGELDQSTSGDVREKIDELSKKYSIKNIIFNCENLIFMDSSGIGVILSTYNKVRHTEGRIFLCELNRDIEKIIFVTGLNKICKIVDTEDSVKWQLGVA